MDSNTQLPINEKVDPISRQKWPANFKKFKFPARQKPKHLIQLPKNSLTRWPCWRLTTRLERTVTLTAVAQIVQNRRKQFTTIQSNSSNGPTRIGQFNFQRKFPKKNWNQKTKSTRCGWGGGCGSTVSSAASLCSFSDLVSFPFDRGEKATSGGRGYPGRDAPHWSAPNPSGGRGFRAPLNKTKFISQLARLIKRYRHANCFQWKF